MWLDEKTCKELLAWLEFSQLIRNIAKREPTLANKASSAYKNQYHTTQSERSSMINGCKKIVTMLSAISK